MVTCFRNVTVYLPEHLHVHSPSRGGGLWGQPAVSQGGRWHLGVQRREWAITGWWPHEVEGQTVA